MGQSPGPGRTYNQLAGTSVARLSGISDGIFSVGMTLLVLGLAVPALSTGAATEGELWSALAKLGPNVLDQPEHRADRAHPAELRDRTADSDPA
jgi:hypothetical protein